MSGGTSTPWLATLCGVVMAFSVLGTGCAVDATGEADDADEVVAEAQSDLTLGSMKVPGGLHIPKIPAKGTLAKTKGTPGSPTTSEAEVADPLPEPWVPDGRDDPSDDVSTDKTPSRTDDHQK